MILLSSPSILVCFNLQPIKIKLSFIPFTGFQTTKALLRRNATVIMACRDVDRATEAAMLIRKTIAEGTFVSPDQIGCKFRDG